MKDIADLSFLSKEDKIKLDFLIKETNFNIVFKDSIFGLLSPMFNYTICNWYSKEELLLYIELYYKKVGIVKIEDTINILRNASLIEEEGNLSIELLDKNSILELIKAVLNLKEISLYHQSQLITLFNTYS